MGPLFLRGPMTRIAFTGHRPKDIAGTYDETHPTIQWVKNAIKRVIRFEGKEAQVDVISGMALGVDTWAAEAAIELGVAFEAAVPFKGQEKAWPGSSQDRFHELLSQAAKVTEVCEPGYAGWKMQHRNEYMVDAADVVVAVWDGDRERRSGTKNCVLYAEAQGKRIIHIHPTSRSIKELP